MENVEIAGRPSEAAGRLERLDPVLVSVHSRVAPSEAGQTGRGGAGPTRGRARDALLPELRERLAGD